VTESGGTGNPAGSATPPPPDQGTIVPEGLPDAPAYVPPPVGMTPGGVMPPTAPPDAPSSAWITTAPQVPPKRGIGSRIGGAIVGIIGLVVAGVVIAGVLGLLPNDKGKVLFGTAAGSDLCGVGNATTTIRTSDPVFFSAVLKHHMDGQQAITLTITKDGAAFVDHDEPADGTSFDCYGTKESLGPFDPGTYVFTVTHNTDVEATGTLVVTQ
jgi:hypothetical protein